MHHKSNCTTTTNEIIQKGKQILIIVLEWRGDVFFNKLNLPTQIGTAENRT